MGCKNIQILLIEDNPGDIRLIQEILDQQHTDYWQLIAAENLAQGLDKLTGGNIDLVLLDLGLPDSSGLATLRTIRHQARHMPVIVLTGLDDDRMAMEAIRNGAQDYLVKGQFDRRLLTRSIYYSTIRMALLTDKEQPCATPQVTVDNANAAAKLLPICIHCKNIRDNQDRWHELETFFQTRTNLRFTHGICPRCASLFYSELLSDPKETL